MTLPLKIDRSAKLLSTKESALLVSSLQSYCSTFWLWESLQSDIPACCFKGFLAILEFETRDGNQNKRIL
jgi:hypothetical protein